MSETNATTTYSRKSIAVRIICFILAVLVIFNGLCFFFSYFEARNIRNASYGFYSEPENTIETVFLGSSVTAMGFNPTQLYEEYGLSAYNLGSNAQPMMVSYYWLQEVYQYHPESLRIVVLDVSSMRKLSEESFYRMGFDHLRLSTRKVQALWDYTDGNISETISLLCPLFSYHSKWETLSEEEFTKADVIDHKITYYNRGYDVVSETPYFESTAYDEIVVPNYNPDYSSEEAVELPEENMDYMERIIQFCKEHDLQLVLTQPIHPTLPIGFHNAIQNIADENDLGYVDFNYNPVVDEIGFNIATNFYYDDHCNYWGASKLTSYIGQYLVDHCDATDVRGQSGYEFLDDELQAYHERITDVIALKEIDDPAEYLQLVTQHADYTICIVVSGDAADALTEEQRAAFADLGLTGLSEIGSQDSYIAVLEGDQVRYEERIQDPGEEAPTSTHTYSAEIQNVWYELQSGGSNSGNYAEVAINGAAYVGTQGINVVVYDNTLDEVINQSVFDTHESAERIGANLEKELDKYLSQNSDPNQLPETLHKLYLYNQRCEKSRLATEGDTTTQEQEK